ncbi:hypothetical protein CBA19CS11_31870 [Caballeronia novacaledonica]|uniref:UPF0391 membrane protein CBA19CS42_14335 n=4 Tax=Caballeronia TaxID=1827195 RepID=A0AA37I9B5_9BURK|nr:hypothetical protein CBA19CS11_31870 [Caballeronia novacaledonica]GJH25705.1 hypothetical protein CBA19CS42_14335 [Caballeronia novacaledonica]
MAYAGRSKDITGKSYAPSGKEYCLLKLVHCPRHGARGGSEPEGHNIMLYYALVFFIIAIIAAALGFGGIAAGAASIAKILFFIFLVIFLVTLVMGLMRR